MTSSRLKRFRPRFSIRTLAIVVTLACCYAACWGPTKRQGEWDVFRKARGRPSDAKAVIPLIVEIDGSYHPEFPYHDYYFWFFGYVAKLPWEREIP